MNNIKIPDASGIFATEKGVRFIAVTDDIDTEHIETSEEMVQFKAFFNEWFLRDTSRKDGIKRGWNRNTVKKILQNVTYLGWVSNGNTKKVNYKSKKTLII